MDSDMTMTMDMSSIATTTDAAAAATSTAMSMGNMDGMSGMGGANSCKISMLWNWNTVDACFLSSTWQIRSAGMFAGSCIGVILLTMSLEFLRRLVKEYDRYLVRKHADVKSPPASSGNDEGDDTGKSPSASTTTTVAARCAPRPKGFRPSVLEQAVRALLHMVQFAVAYFIMLLAMYYNGYFIICIFIGAYIGSFIFQWETLGTR